jgi:hypothetical protein
MVVVSRCWQRDWHSQPKHEQRCQVSMPGSRGGDPKVNPTFAFALPIRKKPFQWLGWSLNLWALVCAVLVLSLALVRTRAGVTANERSLAPDTLVGAGPSEDFLRAQSSTVKPIERAPVVAYS